MLTENIQDSIVILDCNETFNKKFDSIADKEIDEDDVLDQTGPLDYKKTFD